MERVILATLAYASASGMPLTAVQVWRRMIQPSRLGLTEQPSLTDVLDVLASLVRLERIRREDGWYASVDSQEDTFERNRSRQTIWAEKWRCMRQYAKWFQLVPYVQALAASGSLASGATDRDSDWDMFAIVRSGRLYTARLGLLIVAQFMGRLRVKGHKTAPDLFCFNHYVTDEGLQLRHQSLFVARAVADMIPFFDRGDFFAAFRRENGWVGDFLHYDPGMPLTARRSVSYSRTMAFIRRSIELVLDGTIGRPLEALLRWWQQWRIAMTPATYEPGGRVIADDQEIEFHPRSSERALLGRYNASLNALGVARTEPDSGLTV